MHCRCCSLISRDTYEREDWAAEACRAIGSIASACIKFSIMCYQGCDLPIFAVVRLGFVQTSDTPDLSPHFKALIIGANGLQLSCVLRSQLSQIMFPMVKSLNVSLESS